MEHVEEALLRPDGPRSDSSPANSAKPQAASAKPPELRRASSTQMAARALAGPREFLDAVRQLWARDGVQLGVRMLMGWTAILLTAGGTQSLWLAPTTPQASPWCADQTASGRLVCIWFNATCLHAQPNGTATAGAFVALTTQGLAFDEALATVVSAMALYAFAQFGGIPVPDTQLGRALYTAWMVVQSLQYAVTLAALLMVVLAYANAMHMLNDCLRGPSSARLSVGLSALATPSTTGLALTLFLYAFALSTGIKVWRTARANPSVHDRAAFVSKLKREVQPVLFASAHFWLAYLAMSIACAALLLTAAWLPGLVALPVCVALVAAIKGFFWLIAHLTRLAVRVPIQGVGDAATAFTGWVVQLYQSSFAPGGFTVRAAFTSRSAMDRNRDDPAWGTLGRTLNVFFVLIASAPAVCLGVWLAIPTVGGVVRPDEAVCTALAIVADWIASGLSAIFTLAIRMPALLSIDAIVQALDDLGGLVRQAWESLSKLAWYLELDLTSLIEGARVMLVLNGLLALVKPVITGLAKGSLVVSRLLTQTTDPGFIGAVSFAECVPSEVEDLCAAVGARPDEISSLVEADWRRKDLDADQCIVIARMLGAGRKGERLELLTSLSLDGNDVGPEGAKALADALRANAVLTSLNLTYNRIGPEGAKAIAEALGSGKAVLTSLDLSFNQLGPEGGKAVAEALPFMAVLTHLDLSGNELDAEAGKALASALAANAVLKKLDLRVNHLGEAAEQTVRDAAKRCSGLELEL